MLAGGNQPKQRAQSGTRKIEIVNHGLHERLWQEEAASAATPVPLQ